MGREEEIAKERLKKIGELRKAGINPYPHFYDKKDSASELQEKYKKLKHEGKTKDKAKTAGRVMSVRDLGQLIFVTLQDSSGKIQIQLQSGETPDKEIEFFRKFADSGDFVGVEGTILRTKRGELTILAKKVEILSKSTKPLPEKWHGLQDKEERYRKRYLDLVMNPEVKQIFIKRENIIRDIRNFMLENSINEVETPLLQTLYGGADAEPFITKLNALDMPLYLSISPELYLKRLIAGGFERVYTICKNFRNEGIDKSHNPEFTMMEVYIAYKDYNFIMEFTENLIEDICKKINGKTKIEYQGKEIDFRKPFKKMSMIESIKKYGKVDVCKMSDAEIKKKAKELGILGNSRAEIINNMFEELVEDKLIEPTFIIDYPKEICPLTKEHRKNPELVERFELFVNGMELANAYSELNDPAEQEKRLNEQAKVREKTKAHLEANKIDSDFVEAVQIGMPPMGGIGIGIDRLVMLFTNSASIRDVILFPFMKLEEK